MATGYDPLTNRQAPRKDKREKASMARYTKSSCTHRKSYGERERERQQIRVKVNEKELRREDVSSR